MSNQFSEGQIVKHSPSGVVGNDMGFDETLSQNGWGVSQGFDFGSLSYDSAPWAAKNQIDEFAVSADVEPDYLFETSVEDLTSGKYEIDDIHTSSQAWGAIVDRCDEIAGGSCYLP